MFKIWNVLFQLSFIEIIYLTKMEIKDYQKDA